MQTYKVATINWLLFFDHIRNVGNINIQTKTCKCEPQFNETTVLARSYSKTTREVMASGSHGACANQPSVLLKNKEIHLLQEDVPRRDGQPERGEDEPTWPAVSETTQKIGDDNSYQGF